MEKVDLTITWSSGKVEHFLVKAGDRVVVGKGELVNEVSLYRPDGATFVTFEVHGSECPGLVLTRQGELR